MNANTIKFTAVAVLGSAALAATLLYKTDEQQTRQQQVQQLLSQADKVLVSADTGARQLMPPNHPAVGSPGPHKVSPGSEKDFLQVADSQSWQSSTSSGGIANLKFRLKVDGQAEPGELAVIRMNKGISLDKVIDIWKQKVGLGPGDEIAYQPFVNSSGQQLYLTSLKGPYKTILLAIYKGDKYTFFRMNDIHSNADNAMSVFRAFLATAKILG